jgi:hypothetical protein
MFTTDIISILLTDFDRTHLVDVPSIKVPNHEGHCTATESGLDQLLR